MIVGGYASVGTALYTSLLKTLRMFQTTNFRQPQHKTTSFVINRLYPIRDQYSVSY